jgi:hypothetical protein
MDNMNKIPLAESARKRLKRLCDDFPSFFKPMMQLAIALGADKEGAHPKQKTKADFRALVAIIAGEGVDEVDEVLDARAFADRRKQQCERLALCFEMAGLQRVVIDIPADVAKYSSAVIDRWQPTSQHPEINVRLAIDMQLDIPQHLGRAGMLFDLAVRGGRLPTADDVQRVCALLSLLNERPQHPRQEYVFNLLKCDVGIIAVQMGNQQTEFMRQSALALFEALSLVGDSSAALHLAKMRFYGWGVLEKYKDVGLANDIVDKLFACQFQSSVPAFETWDGLDEMLMLRAQIKHKLIVGGTSKLDKKVERARELIDTLAQGASLSSSYRSLLLKLDDQRQHAPDPIRDLVWTLPELQGYCRNSIASVDQLSASTERPGAFVRAKLTTFH